MMRFSSRNCCCSQSIAKEDVAEFQGGKDYVRPEPQILPAAEVRHDSLYEIFDNERLRFDAELV